METDENARAPSQGRLVIEKMVLHNFKSYAGTKTVGPFHKVPDLLVPGLACAQDGRALCSTAPEG
jgi:hypothetical protein